MKAIVELGLVSEETKGINQQSQIDFVKRPLTYQPPLAEDTVST